MKPEELRDQIDLDITNETVDDSITPTKVGDNMKEIVNISRPYNLLLFKLSISGTTATPTYVVNDFSDETIEMTIPSNGKLRISITNNSLSVGNTCLVTNTVESGGNPYFLVPEYGFLPTFLDINIKTFENTQTSTPSLSNQWIEIRVYDI